MVNFDYEKSYTLWDSYTKQEIAVLDTRGEARMEQNIYERDGQFQTRIRTNVTKKEIDFSDDTE